MMRQRELRGVIAAIATPVSATGAPDHARLVARAERLLDGGCDALNLLGTTGEATSLTVAQRAAVMEHVAKAGLPLERMMVGTGAAALGDALVLTKLAADLGFAAALVLPPFYYKPVTNEGLLRYIGAIVEATSSAGIPIYLYNFPALTGIVYSVDIVAELLWRFGSRIAGLKDSSGDLAYAQSIAKLSSTLRVFPSNEATLLQARAGDFAGCISATANLNAADCALAFHKGDEGALKRAVAIRAIFNGLPLVPGIKLLLAHVEGDEGLSHVLPPLAPLSHEEAQELYRRYSEASPA